MNVSLTLDVNKTQSLPYTASDLMRMSKTLRPVARKNHLSDPVSLDRYYAVSANPIIAYSPKGQAAALRKNFVGSRVDIRA